MVSSVERVDESTATAGRVAPQCRGLPLLQPVHVLGQLMVWVGGLLILFALFQLWGTGLLEGRAQSRLDEEFSASLAAAPGPQPEVAQPEIIQPEIIQPEIAQPEIIQPEVAQPEIIQPEIAQPEIIQPEIAQPEVTQPVQATLVPVGSDLLPQEGAAIARVTIDSIGLTKTVVQGVRRDTLRTAPGHYPTSPMPGQDGNAAIAGHRTTHGAPFLNLDKVQPGDHIDVETLEGIFRYEVQAHEGPNGHLRGYTIVDPSDVSVIADHGDNRLTLTACHPTYSARQRIVVSALLIGEASPTPVVVALPEKPVTQLEEFGLDVDPGETTTAAPSPVENHSPAQNHSPVENHSPAQDHSPVENHSPVEESLGWQPHELDPTILWATATLVMLHAGWVLGRVWRRRYAYVLALPASAIPLFICFVHLDRLLPAY